MQSMMQELRHFGEYSGFDALQFLDAAQIWQEPPVNIFYLDHDPQAAAQAHCDKHVAKMIVETAQLLSAAWGVLCPTALDHYWQGAEQRTTLAGARIYKTTHQNHPSAVWARTTLGNYKWLHALGLRLCDEYTHRYGKVHATTAVLLALETPPPQLAGTDPTHMEPPACVPEDCVVMDDGFVDAVASYRHCYATAKRAMLTFRNRPPPAWLVQHPTT
jgi:hypothetical protein